MPVHHVIKDVLKGAALTEQLVRKKGTDKKLHNRDSLLDETFTFSDLATKVRNTVGLPAAQFSSELEPQFPFET
jgi:hypothetical protein